MHFGAVLDGYHVLENRKYEGTMGAYFRVKSWPGYGSLNIGASFFGMHYDHNERGMTYGQGGYFSPRSCFTPPKNSVIATWNRNGAPWIMMKPMPASCRRFTRWRISAMV